MWRGSRRGNPIDVVLVASVLCMLPAPHALAAPGSSPPECASAVVSAGDPRDAQSACDGAAAALSFFREAGFLTDAVLHIDVTDEVAKHVSPTAAGCFLEMQGRILLVPFSRLRSQGAWFGVPVTRELYRSMAAHETSHALAACNFSIPNPSMQAKEYVAYVAMFATMKPSLRKDILERYREEQEADTDRISAALLLFDPIRFGVRAYLHYLRQEAGGDFLRAIFQGKALVE